jgi:hypothetical protein
MHIYTMDLLSCGIFDAVTKKLVTGLAETSVMISIFYSEEKGFLAVIGGESEKQFATFDEAVLHIQSQGYTL